MTAPASDGKDSASGRFRLTIPQMLWLVALCGLACGFVVRASQSSRRQSPDQLAFSTDGRLLAASFHRGGVLVWDVSRAQPRIVGVSEDLEDGWLHRSPEWIEHFHFADATTLVKVRDDSTGRRWRLVLWDVLGDEPATVIRLPSYPYGVALSPDRRLAAVANNTPRVDVIDVATGRPVHSLPTALPTEALAFREDGEELLAVERGQLEVFRVDGWTRIRTIEIPPVQVFEVSADGRYLASSDGNVENSQLTVRVISTDGETDTKLHVGIDEGWSFLPNRDQLAVWSASRVQIVDIPTGKQVREFELPESTVDVNSIAVSPDGRTLAVAEQDRISVWDMRSGEQLAEVWRRNAFFEALLFSAGFFGWAVVWGLMRRRRPKTDAASLVQETDAGRERARPKQFVFQITVARLVVMLVVAGMLMAIPVTLLASVSLEGDWTALLMVLGKALLLGPIILFALVLLLLLVKKKILHTHGAELRRAQGIARAAGRTAQFGNITAYFFGAPTLEAHFEQDLATVRGRLETLLGDLAEAPDVPAFCFASQDEFNVYLARKTPLSAVYSPPWWCRQLILCERPGHSIADPRELLRMLLGYLLLWNHKGFRTPYWITSVVNAYAVYGDDAAHLAAVHRRLAVEFAREETLTPLPLELDDKQYVKLVMKRDQREPLRTTLLYSDICASLAAYLMGDAQRRRRFGEFLQGLTRRDGVEEALRRDYGCGVEQLFQDWLAWFRQGIAEGSLDTSTYETPTESERQQIVEDVVPLVLNPDVDLDLRCRAARNLAGGSLLGAEVLIGLLADAPDELRQDAMWSLEAIAGRRLGEDPAAWRSWLAQVKTTASPATEEADSPVDAELLDDSADDGGSPQDQMSPPATTGAASEALSTAKSRPITTPPKTLTICWNLMILGGAVAILWPSLMLFTTGLTWWPLFYYGLAMGVFAVSRGVGRHLRWLRLVGFLQVLAAVSCDPVNPVLGVAVLILSRTKRAREYLAAQG